MTRVYDPDRRPRVGPVYIDRALKLYGTTEKLFFWLGEDNSVWISRAADGDKAWHFRRSATLFDAERRWQTKRNGPAEWGDFKPA